MFSENNKSEIIKIHNFIKSNLNKFLNNYKDIVKYLTTNYFITDSLAIFYIKIIETEWDK